MSMQINRSQQQKIVAPGRRDFQRALSALLALYVAQIRLRSARGAQSRFWAGQHLRALEVVGELNQRAGREDVEIG